MWSQDPTAQVYLTPYLAKQGFYRVAIKRVGGVDFGLEAVIEHRSGQTGIEVKSSMIESPWHDLGVFEFTRGYGGSLSFITLPGLPMAMDGVQMTFISQDNPNKGNKQVLTIEGPNQKIQKNGEWETIVKSNGSSFLLNPASPDYLDSDANLTVAPKVSGTYDIAIKWPLEALAEPYQKVQLTISSGASKILLEVSLDVENAETWYSLGNANITESDTIILSRAPRSNSQGHDQDVAIVGFQLTKK